MSAIYLCNKALCSCIYVCMLAKADSYQTAGTNWMTFFKGTHGNPGGNKG